MASIKYCGSCGAKNEYSLTLPKFCSSCGEAFDKAFAKVKKPTVARVRDEDDNYEEVEQKIHIKKPSLAKVTIVVPQKIKTDHLANMSNSFARNDQQFDLGAGGAVEGGGNKREILENLIRNTKNASQ